MKNMSTHELNLNLDHTSMCITNWLIIHLIFFWSIEEFYSTTSTKPISVYKICQLAINFVKIKAQSPTLRLCVIPNPLFEMQKYFQALDIRFQSMTKPNDKYPVANPLKLKSRCKKWNGFETNCFVMILCSLILFHPQIHHWKQVCNCHLTWHW
jgi:hypothetical protein